MATPSDRLARVIVKYEVDRASAQAVANSAASVASTLRSVGLAANTVGAQADQLRASFASIARGAELDKLAAEMSLAAQQGQSLDSIILKVSADLHRLDANAAEVDRLAHAFDRAEKEARDLAAAEDALLDKRLGAIGTPGGTAALDRRGLFNGGRLQGGALGRLGSELRLLPSVPIPGTSFGTDAVANLLRISGAANTVLQSMGASIASMGVAAGVAAPAVLGLVAAFQAFNATIKDGQRVLEAAVAAQKNYYDALADLTTQQVQAQVAQLENAQVLLRQQIAETANALTGSLQQSRGITDIGATIAGLFNPALASDAVKDAFASAGVNAIAGPLVDDLERLTAQFLENDQTITRLTQGLEANNFATNDARVQIDRIRESLEAIGAIQPPDTQRFGDFAVGLIEGAASLPDKVRSFLNALGEAATQANLDAAKTAGDDFTTLNAALNGTSDSARDMIDRLEAQAQAADISAEALRATGDTSLEATNAINAYNAEAEHSRDVAGRLLNILLPVIEAREAEIALLERQLQLINQRVDLELQAFNVLQSGTVESVDTRIASLNAEANAVSRSIPQLQALARTNVEFEDDLKAAQDRLTAVNQELNLLATLRPDVAARQFREESEKLASQLVKDIARIEAARDNRIAEIEANLGEKEAELAKRRSDDITDAEEKAAARRLDALEDYREAEARINRKFNRDFLNAQANRDALAAFEAKQQRDDDLADARAKLAKQTATIDKALKDQQRVIEKRYNDQLQTARAAAVRAIQLEREKATAEINLRTQAYNAEIQGLQQSLFAQFALQQQFWAASIAVAQRAVSQVMAQSQTKYNPVVTTIPGTAPKLTSAPYQYQIPSTYQYRASGGPAEGWTMVGEKGRELVYFPPRPGGPAQVINHRSTEQMMGGVNVNVVVNGIGLNATQIVRKVDERLHQTLKKAGVA